MVERKETRLKVGDIMTRNYASVKPDISIIDCAKIMIKKKVGSLVVEENKKLLGVIVEKDIIWVLVKKQDLSKIKVRDIMTRRVVVISPADNIYNAILRMNRKRVKILPVIFDKKVVGVLTIKDVLRVEPSLFELASSSLDIREEKDKLKRKEIASAGYGFVKEGICDECDEYNRLYNIDDRLICQSCKEMFS